MTLFWVGFAFLAAHGAFNFWKFWTSLSKQRREMDEINACYDAAKHEIDEAKHWMEKP